MLSIIIVSYNVKYFLEQCLYSIQKAAKGINTEVIVVDNNSTDGSVEYLQKIFGPVLFVANKENTGYARACNQGLQLARGELLLFLNPDTLLAEDCLSQSIQVLQSKKELGALGVRMLDGSGRFLPESKRGFPSPKASFFKLSGLIKIFPHSKTFAQYYLGHLPEKENNEIDVLTGAYLMVKKEVLERTGGFDESFFMYGEDIDLSYRIRQAGYKIYYLADCSIIHFKGESTKRDMAYTKLFYKAMRIFVQKHYEKESWLFTGMIRVAIAVRGLLSFTGQLFLRGMPRPVAGSHTMQTLLVGEVSETSPVAAILKRQVVERKLVTIAVPGGIAAALQLQQAEDVIFCAGTITYKNIIECIENLQSNASYKFYAAESKSIVGSMSKNSSGEILVLE